MVQDSPPPRFFKYEYSLSVSVCIYIHIYTKCLNKITFLSHLILSCKHNIPSLLNTSVYYLQTSIVSHRTKV